MEHRDDVLALQALPDFDRQALLGEDIEDRQCGNRVPRTS